MNMKDYVTNDIIVIWVVVIGGAFALPVVAGAVPRLSDYVRKRAKN